MFRFSFLEFSQRIKSITVLNLLVVSRAPRRFTSIIRRKEEKKLWKWKEKEFLRVSGVIVIVRSAALGIFL